MLGPTRGPMRPFVVIFLVLTVLLVGIIVLAAEYTSPGEARTEALAYLDKVRPIIERSSATGGDVAALREGAVRLERGLLSTQLARAEAEAATAVVDVRAVASGPGGALAQNLLVGALGGRSMALKSLRRAFDLALVTDSPPLPAVQALIEVGSDLVAADGAYRLFGRNLPPGSLPAPESRWVADPASWSAPVLNSFVTALRNSTSLAPVRDLAVLVANPDPGPVGTEPGGVLVLAKVRAVYLQVVVANQGNQAERGVPVVASTQPFDGSPPSTKQVLVDLAPGQRRSIEMPELVPPAVGTTFAIIVRVGATPDAKPVDDEFPARQYVLR